MSRNDGPRKVELSIIMPCLNEAETLEICIRKAQSFLDQSGVSGEIVIGDNGSTDGSQEIAQRCGARVIAIPVRGYGAALYGATQAARGQYCIMGDSDDSYDFKNLQKFLVELRAGYDLVMGNRFKGEIKPGAMPWKNRYIGNPILSAIGKLLFQSPVSDFHCGLRGYSKDAFQRMDLRTTGMEYASEMVIKATILRMKIAEVPITLSPDGRSRPPHLRPYRDGWRHLRFMLLFSPNWLFLYPGLLLILFGLSVGGTIVHHPVLLGHVRLGLDTMIFCGTSIVIGFQAVLFSVLSRKYAMQEGFYPQSASPGFSLAKLNLEWGLAVGFTILFIGIATALYALITWGQHGFGELVTEHIARLVIPASIGISLGFEVILSSFLMSTLALSVRSYSPAPQEEYRAAALVV